GFNPTALFHAIEGGVKRAVLDFKQIIDRLMDSLRDAIAVHWITRQRLENQKLKCALQQICPAICHRPNGFPRLSGVESTIVTLDCQEEQLVRASLTFSR